MLGTTTRGEPLMTGRVCASTLLAASSCKLTIDGGGAHASEMETKLRHLIWEIEPVNILTAYVMGKREIARARKKRGSRWMVRSPGPAKRGPRDNLAFEDTSRALTVCCCQGCGFVSSADWPRAAMAERKRVKQRNLQWIMR